MPPPPPPPPKVTLRAPGAPLTREDLAAATVTRPHGLGGALAGKDVAVRSIAASGPVQAASFVGDGGRLANIDRSGTPSLVAVLGAELPCSLDDVAPVFSAAPDAPLPPNPRYVSVTKEGALVAVAPGLYRVCVYDPLGADAAPPSVAFVRAKAGAIIPVARRGAFPLPVPGEPEQPPAKMQATVEFVHGS
eukprot:tig00000492_g1539.t1